MPPATAVEEEAGDMTGGMGVAAVAAATAAADTVGGMIGDTGAVAVAMAEVLLLFLGPVTLICGIFGASSSGYVSAVGDCGTPQNHLSAGTVSCCSHVCWYGT